MKKDFKKNITRCSSLSCKLASRKKYHLGKLKDCASLVEYGRNYGSTKFYRVAVAFGNSKYENPEK